ncbi:hypothetical protein AVEN_91375-1 [Araneus ventricosus]|uniref:Uncharacterized protein n=1 Tax=Araneus ventricosus TaxID=182803 RepID=A0A4Y2DP68_ARAVE|nr:hypothetical protein AVEN_91375-1 [Araneus ventricosus]
MLSGGDVDLSNKDKLTSLLDVARDPSFSSSRWSIQNLVTPRLMSQRSVHDAGYTSLPWQYQSSGNTRAIWDGLRNFEQRSDDEATSEFTVPPQTSHHTSIRPVDSTSESWWTWVMGTTPDGRRLIPSRMI